MFSGQMRLLKIILFIICLCIIISPSLAVDRHFPYIAGSLRFPVDYDPFPGLGTNYCALDSGMQTALWNPASIAKLKLSNASVTLAQTEMGSYTRSFKLSETSGNYESDNQVIGEYGMFYRYPSEIGPGISTQEINVHPHVNYTAFDTGMNFMSALKINDWLTFGFASRNPLEGSSHLLGEMPTTGKVYTNLYGKNIDQMQIGSDGKLSYTYDDGTTVNTFETTGSLWSGFVTQEIIVPFVSLTEFKNDIKIDTPFISTLAVQKDSLYVGLNIIPVNASANINNKASVVVDENAEQQFTYVPNFDPDSQTEIANWLQDQDKYGTSAGYKRRQLVIPNGQILANAEYRGFYNASAIQFNLGAMYDIGDWLTLGFTMENLGSSGLDFKGNGIASYVSYRDINTNEANNIGNIIDPGGSSQIDLIKDVWVVTNEVSGRTLYLEPEKHYGLPKKSKIGIALKKPILLVIDYEQSNNPYKTYIPLNGLQRVIEASNINTVRIGTESRLFFLPIWMRLGISGITKPDITGLDPDSQKTVDDYFNSFPILPTVVDMGNYIKAWGTTIGLSTKANIQPLFSATQLDSLLIGFSRILYANLFVEKDAWNVNYTVYADPLSSIGNHYTKVVEAGKDREFEWSDLVLVHTLGVSYKF